MGTRLARSWRVFAEIGFGSFVGVGGAAVILDKVTSLIGVLLAHQDDRAANARKHILDCVDGGQVGVDAGGVQQALYHYGLRFLFTVKHLDELLVGIGNTLGGRGGAGAFGHKSSNGVA